MEQNFSINIIIKNRLGILSLTTSTESNVVT